MKQATIFASTIGTIATTTLFVQPPLQAKALDTLPPNLSNSFPKPDTRNILTNPSGITPPEQLPHQPLLIAQTFQAETSNPSPSSPNWQIETDTTIQSPQWTTEAPTPNAGLAQTPASYSPDSFAVDQPPTPEELKSLEDQLDSYEEAPQSLLKPYRASPGITMGVPSGFGSDRGKVSMGLGLQRTRVNTNDGGASISVGLGNAQKGVGVQLSYTTYSINPEKLFNKENRTILSSDRPFGAGGFNLKIHKQFKNGLSVAIGGDSILNIGPPGINAFGTEAKNELEGTYYASATKLFRLKPDVNEPFSSLSVTMGAGLGPRFQTFQSVIENKKVITPFASVALRIAPNASLITEWSGQDFGVGLSWVPFRNLPIVLTPAIRDIFGPDARKPRFVMGFGLGF